MGILSGNPKENPMHYGEVFQLWSASHAAKLMTAFYETYLNHVGDKELRELVGDMLDQARQEAKDCDKLLMDNEIIPAPALPAKPKARLEEIPPGARLSDPEIAAAITADNAAGLVAASQGMGISIREDVGALFTKCHAVKTGLGVRILQMNKDKGWFVPPPLHMKKAELVEA